MLIAILFWVLCLACSIYAAAFGGWEGRAATVTILFAAVATAASNLLGVNWYSTNLIILVIDLAAFVCIYAIAARSDRWWPLWFAAFQLNSVVSHLATVISPRFSAIVYMGYEGLWAIPCLLVMVFGIHRDRGWNRQYDLA